MREQQEHGPLDPFRKLIPRVESGTVRATNEQLMEFGHQSLVEAFREFAIKQPAIATRLLLEAEKEPNGEKILALAMMAVRSVESQMQINKTRKKFGDAEKE